MPMTQEQLEEAIRDLCDKSGLSNSALIEVLDPLKAGYEMLVQEEGEE